MIGRSFWIAWMLLCALGCGEVSLKPFVDASDGGTETGDAGEDEDAGDDDDEDEDGGVDDDDDAGVDANRAP